MRPALVDPPEDEGRAEKLAEKIGQIIHELQSETDKRVTLRRPVEERWINSLRQYYGRYDAETDKRLKSRKSKSKLFVNITRPLTKAMIARLVDLLFPTDDRNWAILPTPVPELSKEAALAVEEAERAETAEAEAMEGGDPAAAMQSAAVAKNARARSAEVTAVMDEARHRAEGMESEIADVLKECRYEAEARRMIRDAGIVGTGIMGGPVVGDRPRRSWSQAEDGTFVLNMDGGRQDRPGFFRVDYWSFFPDPDARCIEDSEGNYIRHLMKPGKLRKLARLSGFDKDAIRTLLSTKPRESAPQYMIDLRGVISDEQTDISQDFYHVWEYRGPLTPEQMACLAQATGDEGTLADMANVDPLDETQAVVWFCQGHILKFALHPLDSGEPVYSVFNIEKDEGSIWGYGIPDIVADPQRASNGAWRMIMDNGRLSAEPQIEVNKDIIQPQRGESWELTGGKIWERRAGADPAIPGIRVTPVESNQAQLAAIVEMAKQMADEMASLPPIARGEPGVSPQKTAQGLALMMNSANVIFRDIVKNYDDDVTTRDIRRAYDWLMQFSKKAEIKGDYEIDARGASVLLVREMQSLNLMTMALNFGAHPVFGPATKPLEVYREIWRSLMLPPDQYVRSESEYEEELSRLAAAAAPADDSAMRAEIEERKLELMEMEIDMKREVANMDRDTRIQVATLQRDTVLMKLAEQLNMDETKIAAMFQDHGEERQHKERQHAAELATTMKIGPSGGGTY